MSNGSSELLISIDDAVATITINWQEKHNALRVDFWSDLRNHLREFEEGHTVRVVVLTGAGNKAFSSGGDIAAFANLTDTSSRATYLEDCQSTFRAIEESPLIIIAAINGWAFGGGCELALACDMVIAADDALFAMPEAKVGLVPGFGVLRSPDILGRQWTKYLIMTGASLNAGDAFRLGLVQLVVAGADLAETSSLLAQRIAANAPLAVRAAKSLVNRHIDSSESALAVETVAVLYDTEDSREGIQAFVDKRLPRFQGK
jgi:enoyl-CoA hydratase